MEIYSVLEPASSGHLQNCSFCALLHLLHFSASDVDGVLASICADLSYIFLCFRGRSGVRNTDVLRHRSHPVQDVGRHLTCTKVSTSRVIYCLFHFIFFSSPCPFLYLPASLFIDTSSDNFSSPLYLFSSRSRYTFLFLSLLLYLHFFFYISFLSHNVSTASLLAYLSNKCLGSPKQKKQTSP